MANRKRAPREVEQRHRALLKKAAADLARKRQAAWEAELALRGRVRDAFLDGVTSSPIKDATGLSTPRLYQIKNEDQPENEDRTRQQENYDWPEGHSLKKAPA